MSNHPRPRVETPSDTVDDLDEPPPTSRQTQIAQGFLEHAHRHHFIDQQQEGYPSSVGVFAFPAISTPVSQGERVSITVAPTQVHPASHPHLFLHTSCAQVRPRYEQGHQQQNQGSQLYDEHGQHAALYKYDPQLYEQPQQSQGQYQQTFPHPSPADSRRHPASLSPSSPGSTTSLLRHPHDPGLLQAQYQAATESGFGLSYQNPDFPPHPDLVPIRFPGLGPERIPQECSAGSYLSDASGPAHSIYRQNSDHNVLYHRYPGALQFPGGHPIAFMQDPALSILNAESYDDGMSNFHAPRSLPSGKSRRTTGDETVRSKRRAKAQSSEAGDLEEEEKKRSRGRPRLDTNDETAKDRRRTQIRLAQRAYRNRKETAIQSLEKKVDDLRRTNEEMSKEFMKLYDFAVSKGMHESTPEFGLQLQATTEKFVSLARRTSEEPEKDSELPASQDNEGEASEVSPTRRREKRSDKSGSPDAAKPAETMYGGFTVSHDEAPPHSTPRSQALSAVHTTSWAAGIQSHPSHSALTNAPLGYEIVTEPTPDNASFPFGMSFEQSLDQAGSLNLSDQPFSEALFSIVSAPSSYAYQERTFGRRLQRSTLEKGYLLLCMPDPPPGLITSAFGFCLLFEPKERIVQRVANCLRVNERETMLNWKFPFLHLGGGGTWFEEMNEMDVPAYPRVGAPRRPVGNQGTAAPHRQDVDSVFGMGPWDAATEAMRNSRIDQETAKLRMNVPGFEGDFYDADEVEWVLRQRGVVIPPAADFVTAEIDPADFSTDTAPGGRILGASTQSNVTDIVGNLSRARTDPLENVAREWLHMNLKPTAASDINLDDARSAAHTDGAPPAHMDIDPSLGGESFGLGEDLSRQASDARSKKRLVTINVGVLVQEIGLKSVCLGRSPGVRPKDLNLAFWASLAA
ncbi:bZIP family transcription factor [Colletotrichum tofieldiae]|uniref:BZIP family transcription factor n=1 Tax=Colletotrichum tofieldiae TaxID=708197 RepID=A0A166US31_9PEZI|nr:bZIP family transcription factor [Colletotrichum tofieldiae]